MKELPKPGSGNLYFVTFGNLDRTRLAFLPAALEGQMGFKALWGDDLALPGWAFDRNREQYLSTGLLEALSELKLPDATRILGITAADLFVPQLNFVFGQAQIGGRECVISTARLDPIFYGEQTDESLFEERVLKESLHELGHTLGLAHCKDPVCVMHFSNSLAETDFKQPRLCIDCLLKTRAGKI